MDKANSRAPGDESTNLAVHIVLNDVGGRHKFVYRETEETEANKESIVENIIRGVYSGPVRAMAFDVAGGWARAPIRRMSRRDWTALRVPVTIKTQK